MAKISGKWTFNNALTLVSQMWYFDYSYGGTECYSMYISNGSLWYCTKDIGNIQVYMEGPGWLGNSYKTIDFGETGQTVDDSFYEWFTANAIQVLTLAEKLTIIANNEQKVYDAGYNEGINKGGYPGGYADGYEEGKKAEYDAFWNAFQDGGKRTDYTYAFSRTWFDEAFKPKYSVAPTNADHMFFGGKMTTEGFKAAIEKGITFDFSNANLMAYAFSSMANLTEIPLDVSLEKAVSASNLTGTFSYNAKLETIKKIILRADGTSPMSDGIFSNSPKLKNVTFEGVITDSLKMGHCTELSADSIRSIITHLSDTASGKTLTLSATAVENAKWDDSVKYIGYSRGPVYSNPISVPQGYKLKVELIVDDDHCYGTATWDDSQYEWPEADPNYWYFALNDKGYYARSYIVEGGTDHTVQVDFIRYTVNDTPAVFSVRAVLVDNDGNEVGENLFSAVEVEGVVTTVGGWETLAASKPNWIISY